MTGRRGATLPMLLIPVLFGILVYWGTLSGSFLSDDYLISRFVGPGGGVLWGHALADFGGPWGGFEGGLYRPLISLSLCVDTVLGGGGPAAFHATNLIFHSISVFSVAWLCGRYARERKGVLALLGGSLLAISPIGVESVAWIIGRVSSQEVAFRLIALCFFTLWLEERRASRYASTAIFALAALLSKESAVILPVVFVGLDLLKGGRGWPLVKRQLAFAPVWLLYSALRIFALSGGGARDTLARFVAFPTSLLPKAVTLFLPGFDAQWLHWAFLAFLILLVIRLGPKRWPWILLAILLWLLQFLPVSLVTIDDSLLGSRILYGPLALTCVLLACALGLPAKGLARGLDSLLVGLLFVTLPFLGKAADGRVANYQKAWNHVDTFRRELLARAPDSSPESPMTLLAAPADRWGIPLLRADTLFSVLEPPFARTTAPMLSLIPVLRKLPEMKELFHDALPVRQLWSFGAPLLLWDGERLLTQKKPDRPQSLEVVRVSDKSFRLEAGSVDPFAIEGLELVVAGEAQSLRLLLAEGTPHQAWQDRALGQGLEAKGGKRHRLLFSHDLSPLLAGFSGGIRGFQLAGEGRIVSLRVLRSLPVIADGLTASQELDLESDRTLSLSAPALPGSALGLRFYLIGPHGGLAIDVEPGEPIRLTQAQTRTLRSLFLLTRQRAFFCFFEARPKPGFWPLLSPGRMISIRTR